MLFFSSNDNFTSLVKASSFQLLIYFIKVSKIPLISYLFTLSIYLNTASKDQLSQSIILSSTEHLMPHRPWFKSCSGLWVSYFISLEYKCHYLQSGDDKRITCSNKTRLSLPILKTYQTFQKQIFCSFLSLSC